jgi:hypothetical protein
LEDFLSRYARVVLVDADARSVDALQRRAPSEPRLCVIQAAVASEAGSGFLYQYNLPDATSIHPATGLLELFPGLRVLDKTPIALESVADVLRSIDMEAHAANTIIVDLPGEEFPVLYTLARLGLLVQFQEVSVHGGRIPLYEGAMPLPEIAHWLKDEGFDLQEEDNSVDPGKPCAHFRRNHLVSQNREIEACVSLLLQETEKLRRDLEDSQQIVAELRLRSEQLAYTKAAAEQLAEHQQAEIEQLHLARAAAEQLAAERQEAIEQLAYTKAAAEQLAEHQQAEIEQLHLARAAAEQLAAERQAQLSSELKEARQTQALALKLQYLRETDLKALQSRYREISTEHSQQRELLGKLADRLVVANQYFQQLTSGVTSRSHKSDATHGVASAISAETSTIGTTRKRSKRGSTI